MTMPWSNTPPATDEEELDIDALDKLVAMEEANLVDFGTKRKALLAKRRGIFAIVMLLVGAGASAAFVSYGFVIKNREQDALFHQRANDITTSIQAAWERYEIFGLWIQESCFLPLQTDTTDTASEGGTLIHEKLRLCTRQRFRMLFDYVSSIGLNFQAAEIIVNVTDDNRHRLEESSKEFYNTQYPHVNYTGIKGFVKDNETGILSVGPQNSQAFYFPVHYAEPKTKLLWIWISIRTQQGAKPSWMRLRVSNRSLRNEFGWHKKPTRMVSCRSFPSSIILFASCIKSPHL